MTLWIPHRWWVLFFFCPCGRFHFFRESNYVPRVASAFVAAQPWDRHGKSISLPARYALVCHCERGHFKFVETSHAD
jgi:hypothetical protein